MSTEGLPLEVTNNFLALEPHLVERVKAAVAGMVPAVHVLTSSELADVKEQGQHTPAVHVIYAGYRVAEAVGTKWRLVHKWLAVAAVRNVANVKTGEAARRDAGVLATKVAMALAGAPIPGATKPLEMVTPPAPRYASGFQYLPSAFEAETVFIKPQP